jgi:hypothetical protein
MSKPDESDRWHVTLHPAMSQNKRQQQTGVHSQPMSMPNISADSIPVWPIWKRLVFRFSAIFLLTAILVMYSPVMILPWIGPMLSGWINTLSSAAAVWVGQHIIHLTGVVAHPHPTDSRDEALDWITSALILSGSILVTIFWSVLDRRRKNYRVASLWLGYILRLSLVFLMLRYGICKIFPIQMNPPSLAVLNEPVGQSSPMTLLWTLIALHPRYEILTGVIEASAAILLFFRRTALAGAILNLFVIGNVLCYNLFFDVPVKQGAILILLITLAVIAPHLRSLYRFFWLHELSSPANERLPWDERPRLRIIARTLEAVFICLTLYFFVPGIYGVIRAQHEAERHPSPLTGEWRVQSDIAPANSGTSNVSLPHVFGNPVTELYLEPDGLAMARSSDGRLWRAMVIVNTERHEFTLGSYLFNEKGFQGKYTYSLADPEHLVLTPVSTETSMHSVLTLDKVSLPTHYPLFDRGFQWVQEWAYER